MSIVPHFANPWALLLLLLIPWSVYMGLRIRSMSRGRRWAAVILRTLILLCLIAALAGMELLKHNDRLAVFFLLDHSNSVPEELRSAAAQWVRNYADAYMTQDDEAGVIVFGEEASIELSVAPSLGLREIRSYVGGSQSDLAEAMRLAMAAFPDGYMRRIVLFSDGNETLGEAAEEAKAARAEGIEVDVVPLQLDARQEVRVREVDVPSQTNTEEPFQVRIVVQSEQEGPATLQVYQRVGGDRRMLPPQQVQLQRGDNVFMLTQELTHSGFYEYEVRVDAAADSFAENNTGRAFTTVHGEPSVLFVQGDPQEGPNLRQALFAEGLRVVQTDPLGMPASLAQLQSYDAVILSDVASTAFSREQLALLEAMVRDLGIGLVVVGGPNSFGAGGYLGTPVERALPLDMDIKQRKIMPRGALVAVLHTCEIPSGNIWARDIALAALNALSAQDLMGAAGYLYQAGDNWIFELQPVGDKTKMRQAIVRGSATIGDMPATGPSLQLAYDALINADAAAKRVVLISDGDPAAPPPALVRNLAAAKIAVSTICIAPHSASDQGMLQGLAQATGGNYYFVNNPNRLPQIFTKEATVVKKGVLIEEEFVPRAHHDSELLFGLGDGELPPLLGYVVTTPKENATIPLVSHEGDPVLAHWRYGLGKSVAFTSDATTRWGQHWLGWEGFNRYWAQAVRWAVRETEPSSLRIETGRRDGMGFLRIDAVDEAGDFVNFLQPEGVVTTPDFEQRQLEIVQTGPGIYEALFPARDTGIYMLNVMYQEGGGESGFLSTGLAVDYSEEYVYNETNYPLLEQVALLGGGDFLDLQSNPFEHDLTAPPTVTPVWPYLVLAAVCLFPLEIFVRRVVLPWGAAWLAVLRFLRRLPLAGRFVRIPELRTAPLTGRYLAAAPQDAAARPEAATVGEHLAPGSAAPAMSVGEAAATKKEAQASEPQGHSAYTQQLLAAKERAKTQRRRDDDEKQGK